jgi:LmbE family N-acetylglucosaminyl deacetylase
MPTGQIPASALVVGAHPDDMEFGAAGTVAGWTDAGAKVWLLLCTNGDKGYHKDDVGRPEVAARRRSEQEAAAKVLGLAGVRHLDYPDCELEPTLELRRAITRVIRELQPEVVITHDPTPAYFSGEFDYVNHPDHRATGNATLAAVYPTARLHLIFPELSEEGLPTHTVKELWLWEAPLPNHAVDLSKTLERKLLALESHHSQLGDWKELREEMTGWARRTGLRWSLPFAEQFKRLRLDEF